MARNNPLEFDDDAPSRPYQRQHDPDLFKKFAYRTLSNVVTVVASAVILAVVGRYYIRWSIEEWQKDADQKYQHILKEMKEMQQKERPGLKGGS